VKKTPMLAFKHVELDGQPQPTPFGLVINVPPKFGRDLSLRRKTTVPTIRFRCASACWNRHMARFSRSHWILRPRSGAKRIFVGLVVVAGLCALLLQHVDLRQLGKALLDVQPGLLTLGLVGQLIVMWIKSIRWALAIRAATGRRVYRALTASIIGFTGNVLLPARLGELLRAGIIEKHNQVGWSVALTTLALTQLLDLLSLAGYFLLVTIWATSPLATQRWEIGLLGILILSTLWILGAAQHKPTLLHAVLRPIHRVLPDAVQRCLTRYTELFVQGLSVLGKRRLLGGLLLLTVTVWVLETASTYLILRAFHINATLTMAAILVVVLSLSFAIPITPGNIGVTQAISVFILGTFGVTAPYALAYSIGAQSASQLLIVILGMLCLYREGMSLNLFRQRSAELINVPTSTMEIHP
jgi:glycosyltransferase 2 family protein